MRKALDFTDVLIALAFVIAFIILNIPAFSLFLTGDSTYYLQLSENLRSGEGYSLDGRPWMEWPPLFSASVLPFTYVFDNPVFAIKSAAVLFSCLSLVCVYFFGRWLRLKRSCCAVLVAFVLSNPFFLFWLGAEYPLSESLGTLLVTAGLMSFVVYSKEKRRSFLLVSGAAFGLAAVTRLPYLFLLLPFGIWAVHRLFRREHTGHSLAFILLMSAPLGLWFLRNISVVSAGESSSLVGLYAGFIRTWFMFPVSVGYYSVALLMLFTVLVPFIFEGARNIWKDRVAGWKMVFVSVIVYYLLLSFVTTSKMNIFTMIRFSAHFIPILTIVSFYGIQKAAWRIGLLRLRKNHLFSVIIIIFAVLSAFLNFAAVQKFVIEDDPTGMVPDTYISRSYSRHNAVSWLNDNASEGAFVVINFFEADERITYENINSYNQGYLREDLVLYDPSDDEPEVIDSYLAGDDIYILSELDNQGLAGWLSGVEGREPDDFEDMLGSLREIEAFTVGDGYRISVRAAVRVS